MSHNLVYLRVVIGDCRLGLGCERKRACQLMTGKEMMSLRWRLATQLDADFLREMIGFAAQV